LQFPWPRGIIRADPDPEFPMFDRRSFLVSAAAAAAALAGPARAEGFQVAPEFLPQPVRVKPSFVPGSIVIVTELHFLYLITEEGQAMRYGVGVGREGTEFRGNAVIQVKKEWPTWRPTDDMIEKEPITYAKFKDNDFAEPGGPGNPLGARAMYLFQDGKDTYFRIHGTNAPSSIGRSVSHGCIRMINDQVIDLYSRVPVGTHVTVL
jgi:lipoprotein-anchoring transpeptidase ErfK/SrfK